MTNMGKNYDTALFILVDALGWEISQRVDFLKEQKFFKKKLRSILGYSSTCYPSIFTGKLPQEHNLWNSYFYSKNPVSPDWIKYCKYFPKKIRNSWRLRNLVSRFLKSRIKSEGYFSLYRVPFEYLQFFDYAEKVDLLKPNAIPHCESIFDILYKKQTSACVPAYFASDAKKLEIIQNAAQSTEKPSFAFAALGELDTFMHKHGPDGVIVDEFIKGIEQRLSQLISTYKKEYKNPYICIFSDHGMAPVTSYFSLWNEIDSLGLNFGEDYIAFYDATMARFWFLNDKSAKLITEKLNTSEIRKHGRLLSDNELANEGCKFEKHQYGEQIFLCDPGIELVPSFMSDKGLKGMHGYHPDDKDSWASLFCSHNDIEAAKNIRDIFTLMSHSIRYESNVGDEENPKVVGHSSY